MSNQPDDPHRYDDIISLPHHVSASRPHMPSADRAAQFSPFAALTGYDAAIKETARLTDEKIVLDEDSQADLNEKLVAVQKRLKEHPAVTVTYFKSDEHKSGGMYAAFTGNVKKIDQYAGAVIMLDGTEIPLEDIIGLDSALFASLEE